MAHLEVALGRGGSVPFGDLSVASNIIGRGAERCPWLASLGFGKGQHPGALLLSSVPGPHCGSPRHSHLACRSTISLPLPTPSFLCGSTQDTQPRRRPHRDLFLAPNSCSGDMPLSTYFSFFFFSLYSFDRTFSHTAFGVVSSWFIMSLVLFSRCPVTDLRQRACPQSSRLDHSVSFPQGQVMWPIRTSLSFS